jgi:hypothetical protein
MGKRANLVSCADI